MPALSYPDPPLATDVFVLRRFRAGDFEAAAASRDDGESARWVNAIPVAHEGVLRSLELIRERRVDTALYARLCDDA